MRNRLLAFDAEQARRGAYARADRGIRTVEVAAIVGSVGRATLLDRRFRYRRGMMPVDAEGRLSRLRALFDDGRVPLVELYQICDSFFVLDGHHRVAVALERGQPQIEAHVVEYLPDRADPANAVYYERLAFFHATGLREVHATEPGRYARLLNRVRDHRHELARERAASADWSHALLIAPVGEPPARRPDLREAARDWYEREYLPVVEVLAAARLPEVFPGRAMGDLYGYVCDHRWLASERRGWDVGVDAALADFVQRHAPRNAAETFVDSVSALGAELIESLAPPTAPPSNWTGGACAAFLVGLFALPFAFLRGLRPRHYCFPRVGLATFSRAQEPCAESTYAVPGALSLSPVPADSPGP